MYGNFRSHLAILVFLSACSSQPPQTLPNTSIPPTQTYTSTPGGQIYSNDCISNQAATSTVNPQTINNCQVQPVTVATPQLQQIPQSSQMPQVDQTADSRFDQPIAINSGFNIPTSGPSNYSPLAGQLWSPYSSQYSNFLQNQNYWQNSPSYVYFSGQLPPSACNNWGWNCDQLFGTNQQPGWNPNYISPSCNNVQLGAPFPGVTPGCGAIPVGVNGNGYLNYMGGGIYQTNLNGNNTLCLNYQINQSCCFATSQSYQSYLSHSGGGPGLYSGVSYAQGIPPQFQYTGICPF